MSESIMSVGRLIEKLKKFPIGHADHRRLRLGCGREGREETQVDEDGHGA